MEERETIEIKLDGVELMYKLAALTLEKAMVHFLEASDLLLPVDPENAALKAWHDVLQEMAGKSQEFFDREGL
jgi:hypothetical protein